MSMIEKIKNVLRRYFEADERGEIEKIKNVLRRYFDTDDNGEVSKTFDEYFTASEAIDEIHEIVGNI